MNLDQDIANLPGALRRHDGPDEQVAAGALQVAQRLDRLPVNIEKRQGLGQPSAPRFMLYGGSAPARGPAAP